jgi:hypothetical protein
VAAIWASWSTRYAPFRFRTGHYLETFFACLYYAALRTGDGTARQERGLKHRADNETRTIPIPPPGPTVPRPNQELRYDPDGRIF